MVAIIETIKRLWLLNRRSSKFLLSLVFFLFVYGLSACQADIPIDTPLPSPLGAETISPQLDATEPVDAQTPTVTPQPDLPDETSTIPSTEVAATEPVVTPPPPSIPDAEAYTWVPVVEGLAMPIGLANAGDGSGRLFVLEQAGLIRIVQDGALLAEPFLNISDRASCCGERGLLGLAFHPNYQENGYFYVNYTDRSNDTVIARFTVSDNPNLALAESEKELLKIPQPYNNHNGGVVEFGPDGFLYLGIGDGGSGGDPHGYAQSLDTLLGKILRLDLDGGDPYAVPDDNPFASSQDERGLPEIWAYGLRNPWRFSFDRLTGDLYIGDVGQNAWEEVNYLPVGSLGGANFGWNYFEGNHAYRGSPPPELELVFPVAEYDNPGLGCSVTGGVVYRGRALPAWYGVYLFGDYCSGRVWGLVQNPEGDWHQELLFENVARITSFGEDEDGEVYIVDHAGVVFQLVER
ncbi:MAG: PQQ-dependent sugar dehydrogenase [Anaerolineales bacterium]|nr:PQQ-dependent sugar dehydrogenase [Anaerolineales bacterium]